jgi:signal transduction histidine kinase
MKPKIPLKLLLGLWFFIILYITGLQYAATDIPYFIYVMNFFIAGFISIFALAMSFFLKHVSLKKIILNKLVSYFSILLIFGVSYNITSVVFPYPYPPNSLAENFLNQLVFIMYLIVLAIALEIFFFVLEKWNNLRKRSITLNLTQTISIILLIIPTMVMIAGLFINMYIFRNETTYNYILPVTLLGKFFVTFATQLFPLTGLSAGTGIFVMIIAAPVVALFSWFVANQYTRRLKLLVISVNELKQGHLNERIEIKGEDEISRLLQDFNEMSASLETQQNELIEKQEKISRLLDSQKEWLLKISHELRTPITTLKAVIESSPAETLEEVKEKNTILMHEVNSLHYLIEDLFTLTQSEHMQLSLDMQPLKIPEQLKIIIEPLQHYAWEQKQIEFVFSALDSPVSILVDHLRLAQVLRNLTHNAVRHTDPGGVISLELETKDKHLVIHFKDTGEGIPEELINSIWQPFKKHPRSDGSGIGLSLAKELVESMNGSISLDSQPNCSACFSLKFPLLSE